MRTLYPPIEPYETGHLDTGDGHRVYYERCGTPGAKPALFVHGGPGAGCSPTHRQLFDPALYDLLLFDQRGCGRSTPHASLDKNTTWHLVADIERLREIAGVERWLVFGGSWGSTLALAYAETPPRAGQRAGRARHLHLHQARDRLVLPIRRVRAVPRQVAALRRTDSRGRAPRYAPRLPPAPDRRRRGSAGPPLPRAWSLWEGETITLLPDPALSAHHDDGHFALAFARLETHYFVNECWLEPKPAHPRRRTAGGHPRYHRPTAATTCPARPATPGRCTRRGSARRFHLDRGCGPRLLGAGDIGPADRGRRISTQGMDKSEGELRCVSWCW